jgi:CDP-glycerol glycerophosphotransferase (TagB/SpsB family)
MRIKDFAVRCLTFLAGRLPAKRGLWLFGAWGGDLYADNSKYLMQYVCREKKDVRAVWITRNRQVIRKLRAQGTTCYGRYSLRGIWCCLRAEACFVTYSTQDVNSIIDPKKTMVFDLWHGLGVKDTKWVDENGEPPKAEDYAHMREYRWFGTSPYFTDTLSAEYFADKDKFYITGFPRNDTFVHKPRAACMEALRQRYPGKKFVIYMPTHRNFGADENAVLSRDSLTEADALLRARDIMMVLKPHYYELALVKPFEGSFTNIVVAADPAVWGDPYEYLHYFDGVISDYSSVTSDFICSGKPAVLFPYDIEHYKTHDGGILPIFWEAPAGPSCYTWAEVISTMSDLFVNDTWAERRERCRRIYHQYNDGLNCRRAYETAVQILAQKGKENL